MGGCYNYSDRSVEPSFSQRTPSWQTNLKEFQKTKKLSSLVEGYKGFFQEQESGFFAQLAQTLGIKDVTDIPKEFSEIEYEVKFDLTPRAGKGQEPGIKNYLEAFDFPVTQAPRFMKDPVNALSVGVNSFLGDGLEEKLVVIEKGGKNYLKEKGPVLPLEVNVPYQEIIVKRTEVRYQANMEQIIAKVAEVRGAGGDYQGKIRKEKGDAFILDTNDGRIYSFTITRAHLVKPGETKESAIQRQLEIEYAGFLPGFRGLVRDSEKQIVEGMVDLAKYVATLYNGAPLGNGWRVNLGLTHERKYDFVSGRARDSGKKEVHSLEGNLGQTLSEGIRPETLALPTPAYAKR